MHIVSDNVKLLCAVVCSGMFVSALVSSHGPPGLAGVKPHLNSGSDTNERNLVLFRSRVSVCLQIDSGVICGLSVHEL